MLTDVMGFRMAGKPYDAGRPEYPLEAIRNLCKKLRINCTSSVLDIAAGTGKLTLPLRQSSAQVTAIDRTFEMLKFLKDCAPSVNCIVGEAEALPLSNSLFDAVVVGQAFHWFASKSALCEIHRVLKTGAMLGLIWNIRDDNMPWVRDLEMILTPYRKDAPVWRNTDWKTVIDNVGIFSPAQVEEMQWVRNITTEEIVHSAMSRSYIAAMNDGIKKSITVEIHECLASHTVTSYPKALKLPYNTRFYYCSKV